jgi:hypothetical protein
MAETSTFQCAVSADLFSRALVARSSDNGRFYLTGINVEPCPQGGVVLVGTDGHRLVALRDPLGVISDTSAIVRLNPVMIKALAAKPRRGGPGFYRVLAVRGGKAAVVEFGTPGKDPPDYRQALECVDTPNGAVVAYQWWDTIIDGQFPDWRRAVGAPKPANEPVGPVNHTVLAPVVRALSEEKLTPAFKLWPSTSGSIFVQPYNPAVEGIGIVMPMRDLGVKPLSPEWVMPAVQAEAA